MKFIHCADIHLDSPLVGLSAQDGAPVDLLRGATRRAFESLIALAETEAVDFVVIAGDLYDGDWRDFTTGLFFVQQMARLKRAAIPVFVVWGNHDAENRITRRLPLPDNVTVFDPARAGTATLPMLQVALHGQSFGQRDVTTNLAAAYPPPRRGWFNIGVLHTGLDGREGHANYAPCDLAELVGHGYDYWALGHIHRREVLHEFPHIVFPGNIQGRHIRETGVKGCSLVMVEDGKVVAVEHRATDVLRWAAIDLDISGCDTLDAVLRRLRPVLTSALDQNEGRPLAARLTLRGPSRAQAAVLNARDGFLAAVQATALDCAGDQLWIEKVERIAAPGSDTADLAARPDGLGALVRAMAEIGADPGFRADLAAELAEISSRLPRDSHAATPDDGNAGDADAIDAVIAEAMAMVMGRLMDHEPTP
ncbi:MAG: DNA repair exonuclease [Azospirillaceae bacterium]|nr:DNA repair exonuclease [Azospirillaceae bacterium]